VIADLFGDKVERAIKLLKSWEPEQGYTLAFSGGKDSVVLYELAVRSGVKFHAYYSDTTIDPPEVKKFIRDFYPTNKGLEITGKEIEIKRPPKSFYQLVATKGLPGLHRRWCCQELKESVRIPGILLTGIRWSESVRRSKRRQMEVCRKFSSLTFLNPIIDWSTAEVWQFIKENYLPYCKLYDEGWVRIGCLFCPMTDNQKIKQMEARRYPNHVKAIKNAIAKFINTHPGKLKYDSPDKNFSWYIYESGLKNEEVLPLFEN